MNVVGEFVRLLEEAAIETGKELKADLVEIQSYVEQRIVHLSRIIDQPGYREALIGERDALALMVGVRAFDQADAADQRLIGIVTATLASGARALA